MVVHLRHITTENMTTMGKADTSKLMMMTRSKRDLSVTHIQPHIVQGTYVDVIIQNNFLLKTLFLKIMTIENLNLFPVFTQWDLIQNGRHFVDDMFNRMKKLPDSWHQMGVTKPQSVNESLIINP